MPELTLIVVTWPIAAGFVASVATICLSVIKIVQIRKEKVESISPIQLEQGINPLKGQLAIQGTLIKEIMDDIRRHEEHLDRVNDQFIKILSDK